jgi:hypothetical protein
LLLPPNLFDIKGQMQMKNITVKSFLGALTISLLWLVMSLANQDTKIIAGHLGVVVSFAEIQQQLEMFEAVSGRIQTFIAQRKALSEVLALKPTAEFYAARAAGAITADQFVTLVYSDLSR